MNKKTDQNNSDLAKEIAARKLAEEKLTTLKKKWESREKGYNKLLHSFKDIVLFFKSDGRINTVKPHENSKLFKKNIPQGDLSIYTAFNEELTEKFSHAIKECLAHKDFTFVFQQSISKNILHFEARLTKIAPDEVLAVIRDTTPLVQNKKELEEAKANEEIALRSRSEFLTSVSHEIRTPLNAILGFSQWLFENTHDPQHLEYLKTILQSSRNLLNLLNDILDLSKIESGKMDIDINPMNYNEVINDIKLVFQRKVEEKGLTLKITTDSTVPGFICMDELRFYQIIFNLVSNAVKFTDKGHVHISAHAVQTKDKDEVNLIISIEDTGIGIKEDRQKSIFDTFTQQNAQNNKTYEGTGLGLAIVQGLLKKLNGTIDLQSKPGKGSVFTVTFFKVKVDRTENIRVETIKEGAAMKLAPCTIMIADDINYNTLVLKQLISSDQVTYIEASDGTEALAKLKTERPDIIFMDIRMPGISGFDATELIKQDNELKHIPVIAFTASTLKDQNSRINSLFDGFLQKPVFKKDLEALLKRFLKFSYVEEEQKTAKENYPELPEECKKNLPFILKACQTSFYKKWEQIKDNLIIFEIKGFKNELGKMASKRACTPILDYCAELESGLKSFDVELIKRKLNEFPELIKVLETLNKK
jgi:signal transduction histidine kinase/CheY-like chemotaxis protein